MESIKYYKLVSPYPEDETLNCKLTMSDLDSNFLAFKDNDIRDASYDPETMAVTIFKNNGDKVVIDMSSLGDDINGRIERAVSGLTPSESGCCDINLSGELKEDGKLVLTWDTCDGEKSVEIGGFLTEADATTVIHDSTLKGSGTSNSPLKINTLERTGSFPTVIALTETLPESGMKVGDRYVTSRKVSTFGRLYTADGLSLVDTALKNDESPWRVPTAVDWYKLLSFAEACDVPLTPGMGFGQYIGDISGKVLKSRRYWEGNENLDTYGFGVVPAGYVVDGMLYGKGTDARFWMNTSMPFGLLINGFNKDHNNVLVDIANGYGMYSIRLVRDLSEEGIEPYDGILGNTYGVVAFPEIGQAWITENLSFNPGSQYSEQYSYDYSGIVKDVFVMCYWNGSEWEKRELSNGDEFKVESENGVTTYVVIAAPDGRQYTVKGASYQERNGRTRLVIDAGWY